MTGRMGGAPRKGAPGSPEVLGDALSQLLLVPPTLSLLDLPGHVISTIVDILLLQNNNDERLQPSRVIGAKKRDKQDDIASFRSTCSMFNNLVLAGATRMVIIDREHYCLPVRLLQSMPNLQLLDLTHVPRAPLSLEGLPSTITTLHIWGPLFNKLYDGPDAWLRAPILDLSPLPKCTGLTDLDISCRGGVADISALAECKNLDKLNIHRCFAVRSLSPLAPCAVLRILNLGDTGITDLSPLPACKELEMIVCISTKVSDLSPLSACLKLRDVSCFNTPVSDLSPLSTCLKLRKVNCRYTPVSDLSPLSACSELSEVLCDHTSVRDITSLSPCPQLRSILCDEKVRGLQYDTSTEFFRFASHRALPKVRIQVSDDE